MSKLSLLSCLYKRRAIDPVRDRQLGDRGLDPAPDLHAPAMHAQYAWQLHQAQAHHTRGIHIRGDGRVGTTGK